MLSTVVAYCWLLIVFVAVCAWSCVTFDTLTMNAFLGKRKTAARRELGPIFGMKLHRMFGRNSWLFFISTSFLIWRRFISFFVFFFL